MCIRDSPQHLHRRLRQVAQHARHPLWWGVGHPAGRRRHRHAGVRGAAQLLAGFGHVESEEGCPVGQCGHVGQG
eukprot:14398408-Alexandrium_andersonii.AAC.1